jgi:hypothetical protein
MGQGQLRAPQDTLMAKAKIDPFDDLSKIALPAELVATMNPLSWLKRLKNSESASTIKVAVYLHYHRFRVRGSCIQLPNVGLEEFGVSRFAKWRALVELERAGLIRIERRPRKSPLIHIIEA